MRSPVKCPCLLGPSSEGKYPENNKTLLLAPPTSFTGADLSTSYWERLMWPSFGWSRGWYQDSCWRLGSVLGNLAKAAWMCALENTSHAEQSWGWRKRMEDKKDIEAIAWFHTLRSDLLVIIAFVWPAVLIVLKNPSWFCCGCSVLPLQMLTYYESYSKS